MHTLKLGRAALVSGLWLLAACGNGSTRVPPAKTAGVTESTNIRPGGGASCKKDSDCPSGQRCGFTGANGCEGRGTCVVESAGANCFDPGGRCGCDGRPVDLFCAKGSSSEFASAPVGFVGGCPISCADGEACPPSLTCQNGFCGKPAHPGANRPKTRKDSP